LQEQTLAFGSDRNRFQSLKRTVEDKNCGPIVKTIMTRCIHCTRCVRFFQDVAGIEEFGTTLRGQETEIGSYIGKSLNSELSGNIIDLCPVGALTSKPYAFTARPWEIKSVESVDIMDSVGSSIKINFKETELLRILPLPLENLNEEWISDKTRFFFDSLKTQRLGQCFKKVQIMGQFKKISWKSLLDEKLENMAEFSQLQAEEVLFVCGNNLDLKTIYLLKEISQISGVSLITESFNEVDLTLMPNFKLNTTFEDILSSDSCLTLGSNVRFEASLLNVRLKKRVNIGGFSKASIGLCDNFTYSNDSIGNSFRIFVSLVEGRHIFCKTLVKAKAPFLILGTSVKKRLDSNVSTLLLSYLSQNTNLLKKDWFGINFLSTTSSHFGESFLGIKSHNKSCLDSKKFIYCVGVEFFENYFQKLQKTIIL
jgi:NADH dehydrogenase/NADH:ubiquinone oxidoreductase subunit G